MGWCGFVGGLDLVSGFLLYWIVVLAAFWWCGSVVVCCWGLCLAALVVGVGVVMVVVDLLVPPEDVGASRRFGLTVAEEGYMGYMD